MLAFCDNRGFLSSAFCEKRDVKNRENRDNVDMIKDRDQIRLWLQAELDKAGRGSKGRLAAFIGVRPDAITRMLNVEKETREIGADELVKMMDFFKSSPPYLKNSDFGLTEKINAVKVIGKVAANNWISVNDMDFDNDSIETIPSVGGHPVSWQFALIVEGTSLNRVARNGDRLACLDVIASNVDIENDDLVIVERRRYGGEMVERTAKRIRQTTNGVELWPESDDPAHQEPIKLYDSHTDEIRIVGKVIWILRKP